MNARKKSSLARLSQTVVLTLSAVTANAAEISGYILDYDTAEPVNSAQLLINDQAVNLDEEGFFSFESDAKEVRAVVSATGYEPAQKVIQVVDGQINNLSLSLVALDRVEEEDEYATSEVIGRYVPPSAATNERDAAAILDSIGAEDMARSGDSNVASALKRVVGLSVKGGKYVSIRGLDGRYIATRFNGATMPSTNPTKREVPLDLIPSSIIESINVNKGFTANLPGDSTGGTVELITKRYETKPFQKIGFTLGGNSLITGKSVNMYDGGDLDWMGYDYKTRQLPLIIDDFTDSGKKQIELQTAATPDGFTQPEIDSMGHALPVNYQPVKQYAQPNIGIDYSLGSGFKSGDWVLGYTAGFKYSNKWSAQREGYEQDLSNGDQYQFHKNENQINLLGMLTASGTYLDDHTFTSNTLLTRISDNEYRFKDGFAGDQNRPTTQTDFTWRERQVLLQQFLGEHSLPDMNMAQINWALTGSYAIQYTPDTMSYQYTVVEENAPLSFNDAKFSRQYGRLDDYNVGFDTDFKWPFYVSDSFVWDIHTGLSLFQKDRESELLRFKLKSQDSGNTAEIAQQENPNDVLHPDNIHSEAYQIENGTVPSEQYDGQTEINAVFLATKLDWTDDVEVLLGARLEESRLEINTYQGNFDTPLDVVLENTDLLPSANISYSVTDKLKLRGGYSQTISRPELRELAPSPYVDDDYGFEIIGNINLKQSSIQNWDARAEWYFNDQDNVSLALFYKHIDDPIERMPINAVGNAQKYTFINNKTAQVKGFEVDFRKTIPIDLGYVHEMFVSGNYAHIDSEVVVRGASNVSEAEGTRRPLQGQPEYVLNMQLGWEDILRQQQVTLSYNLTGKSLFSAYGTFGNEYIVPQNGALGVNYEKTFSNGMTLSASMDNILDDKVVHQLEDFGSTQVVRQLKKGRELSLGFGYKW